MLATDASTRQLNVTCTSSVDMELFLHYSLIPSSLIILALSFLQRQAHHRQEDDTTYLLGNHFGIIMPLDFVGTFSNRWSYGVAFGATANKVMFLFSEGYQPLQVPQWAQAFVLLIGAIEVGLSYFPLFACLSSEFRLVSSVLGFSYSLLWFAVTILQVSQCPHGQALSLSLTMEPSGQLLNSVNAVPVPVIKKFVGRYESLVFYWPSLLCLAFLLGRFLHMFVKALRMRLRWEPQAEEKSELLETHQAEHVKRLLRKAQPQAGKKSWFQSRIYEWDPCFQFPSRMIGTIVLASICLYLFVVIEFCVFVHVRDKLDVFEGQLENYISHMNHTGVLTPFILQVQELISVAKVRSSLTLSGAFMAVFLILCVSRDLGYSDCLITAIMLWSLFYQQMTRIFLKPHWILNVKNFLKDGQMNRAWVVTILPASLTCVSYLFHILACYRKHMKRLWAGDKHFLPLKLRDPSPSESVAAIARYSGWQIAYILWGYLIIHVMQSLCGIMITYSLVLPIIHHQGLEMLRGLGLGILTMFIVVGLMILQVWIAASFFLQPKLGTADKQKPLALNNRKAFHNFNYFLFFYNVLLGLGACLFRLLISCIVGTWLIARIDRTIMQSGYERADMGFSAWVGMLYVDHYHTNPVLVSFCHILITSHRERKLQKTIKYWCLGPPSGPHISARTRTRWLLLQTLINNPRLIILRKPKSLPGSQEFTQLLLTCSDC